MAQPEYVPLRDRYDPGTTAEEAAQAFHEIMVKRRTVREYSDRPVSEETIRWLIRCAGSAPSGANKQPWRFVCVQDPDIKREIRLAAEEEERAFYEHRAGKDWLEDLEPLGTDSSKPFIEVAPWVIVAFKLTKTDDGGNVYYINESVGLACGFLLAAGFRFTLLPGLIRQRFQLLFTQAPLSLKTFPLCLFASFLFASSCATSRAL